MFLVLEIFFNELAMVLRYIIQVLLAFVTIKKHQDMFAYRSLM